MNKMYDLSNNNTLHVYNGVGLIFNENDHDYMYHDFIISDHHSAIVAVYEDIFMNDYFKWNSDQSIEHDINGFIHYTRRKTDYGYIILNYEGMYCFIPLLNEDDYNIMLTYLDDFVGMIKNDNINELKALIRITINAYRLRSYKNE